MPDPSSFHKARWAAVKRILLALVGKGPSSGGAGGALINYLHKPMNL